VLGIRLRSLARTSLRAGEAAVRLAAAVNASEAAFLRAGWDLAEVIAPVRSEPLSYILDPRNLDRFGCELGTINWRSAARSRSVLTREYLLPSLARDARRMAQQCVKIVMEPVRTALHGRDEPPGPARQWLWRSLKEAEYAGRPPDELLNEHGIELGAFIAFHNGKIARFAQDALQSSRFRQLRPFWKGYLLWHAGMRRVGTGRLLKAAANDRANSAGERKTALLLLWTDSPLRRRALETLTRANQELFSQDVRYRRSPGPPVAETPPVPRRSLKQMIENLIEKAGAVRWQRDEAARTQLPGILFEFFDATAVPRDLDEYVKKLTGEPLRALVYGAKGKRLLDVVRATAALTGRPQSDWVPWDSHDASVEGAGLPAEIAGWRSNPPVYGPILQKLREKTLIALLLDNWKGIADGAAAALASLLAEPVRLDVEWVLFPADIFGTRFHFSASDPVACPLTRVLADGFRVDASESDARPGGATTIGQDPTAKELDELYEILTRTRMYPRTLHPGHRRRLACCRFSQASRPTPPLPRNPLPTLPIHRCRSPRTHDLYLWPL